ncbi:DUF202 domain-containing protein [Herbiconiux liukaitaii]|uniref:DUF202 domain-containing protein n=1 Tax=Herbiconiux liukaitaii TaxID=3342799 RepID=UPI0035B7BB3B
MTRDPGLQPERTALAWQRTALSTAMVAVVVAFACLRGGFLIGTLLAGLVAVGAAVTLFVGRRQQRSAWTPLVRITALIMATAVIGAVLAVLILF